MIREIGVAAVPGSSFFHEPVNRFIRLHFARADEVLTESLKRLETVSYTHLHQSTAPCVSPATMYRWRNRKMTITGTITSTAPAISTG